MIVVIICHQVAGFATEDYESTAGAETRIDGVAIAGRVSYSIDTDQGNLIGRFCCLTRQEGNPQHSHYIKTNPDAGENAEGLLVTHYYYPLFAKFARA